MHEDRARLRRRLESRSRRLAAPRATRLRAISFRSRRARRRAAPRYEDDRPDEEFTAGQTYFVGPGHIPKILGDKTCIMVEFAESANKIYENIDKSD